MEYILEFIKDLIPSHNSIIIIIAAVIILFFMVILVHAYKSGRKIKIWKLEIEGSDIKNIEKKDINQKIIEYDNTRLSLLCSTSLKIQNSIQKTNALKYFYEGLIKEITRTPYGINSCGAEPLRKVLFEDYCEKLYHATKSQIEEINKRVYWYWFPSDNIGFNYEPAFYNSLKTGNAKERLIKEVSNSKIIVALSGRTGTKSQIETLISYHQNRQHEIDLNQKPLIMLAWFGGSVREIIEERGSDLDWILSRYPELEPEKEIMGWEKGENPKKLAQKLIKTIIRLLSELDK